MVFVCLAGGGDLCGWRHRRGGEQDGDGAVRQAQDASSGSAFVRFKHLLMTFFCVSSVLGCVVRRSFRCLELILLFCFVLCTYTLV